MKRTFSPKRNVFSNRARLSPDGVALILVLLVVALRLVAPNLFWKVFTPVFRASDSLASAAHTVVNGFSDRATLATANEELARQNAALASENEALTQKESAVPQTGAGIPAGVVARPPESPYDSLVVAAGKRAGVTLGMEAFALPAAPAASAGAVPIGTVTWVSDSFSRITLFSAPGVETGGWVGRAAVPFTLVGAGAGALRAALPRSAPIATGDIVSVPGPGALPIGSVVRVDSNPSSPEVTLQIAPFFNLFSTTWVLLRDSGAAVSRMP